MIVGCYTVHLYCDFGKSVAYKSQNQTLHGGRPAYLVNHRMEFTGPNLTACLKEAKKDGWRIYPAQGKAKCPSCVKAKSDAADEHGWKK